MEVARERREGERLSLSGVNMLTKVMIKRAEVLEAYSRILVAFRAEVRL